MSIHPVMQRLADKLNRTDLPPFVAGDTVRVQVKIKEGDKERLQAFEGIVIARKNGPQGSFTVRKMSFGQPDAAFPENEDGPPRSTHGAGGLLDYPHYTRPAEFRGLAIPEVLSGGNHDQIRRWRREKALEKTLQNRPDLLKNADLTKEDRAFLTALKQQNP